MLSNSVKNVHYSVQSAKLFAVAVVAILVAMVGGAASASSLPESAPAPATVKLGYFPNITHAPALVGVQDGIFAKALGHNKLIDNKTFNAGPDEVTALLTGSINMAFMGPSSALTGYVQSHGAISIIAGAASGGAELVVKPSITSVSQLKGTKLGSPQLGNTQDIALRYFLKKHGFTTTPSGGGDVHIQPEKNGTIVTAFKAGALDGAWVPQPYAAELVHEGGHVLVNEASLWPKGEWATTNVVVLNTFLHAHPAAVKDFLKGLLNTLAFMKAHPAKARAAANARLKALTGKALPASVLKAAWKGLKFTPNPLAKTIRTQVAHGEAVGLLKNPGKLGPVFKLKLLDEVLKARGERPVPGL